MKDCIFCQLAQGLHNETLITKPEEIIHKDEHTTSFISCEWWPNNEGHVLVIPNQHFDNLYQMPEQLLGKVYAQAKNIVQAMKKAYGCEGTSTRQHNETAGGQTVFHYHVHVFPRYQNDQLYQQHDSYFRPSLEQRLEYAELLKSALK